MECCLHRRHYGPCHKTVTRSNNIYRLLSSATSTPHVPPYGSAELIGSYNNDTNRLTSNPDEIRTVNGRLELDETRVNGTGLDKINNRNNNFIHLRDKGRIVIYRTKLLLIYSFLEISVFSRSEKTLISRKEL